jgi:hypothetical protein
MATNARRVRWGALPWCMALGEWEFGLLGRAEYKSCRTGTWAQNPRMVDPGHDMMTGGLQG